MNAPVRKAIEMVVAQRGLQLDSADITALAQAAVSAAATAWVDDEQAMAMTERSNVASYTDFCRKYGVTRVPMTRRDELEEAIRSMPGRGYYRRQA